jgi:hypothetical protein
MNNIRLWFLQLKKAKILGHHTIFDEPCGPPSDRGVLMQVVDLYNFGNEEAISQGEGKSEEEEPEPAEEGIS